MQESAIEAACRDYAWTRHKVASYKLTSRVGVPDRIFLHKSRAMFIEFKALGQVPRAAQVWQQKSLIKAGFLVANISSVKKFKELIDAWVNL